MLFGALGALARYGVSALGARWMPQGTTFPWPTLLINIVGSFLLGVVVTLVVQRVLDESWRFALGVGFLGAFTTFSTFSVETEELLRQGEWRTATIYVGCSLVLAVVAAALGRVLVLRLTS
jgi:CrcB protein